MSTNLPELMKKYWDRNDSAHPHWPPRNDYYEHYMTWAGLVKPTAYLEIGVMYGWSTMAVLLGARSIQHVALFDNELYQIPVTEARRRIIEFCIEQGIKVPEIVATKMDTTRVSTLGVDRFYDLVHVDGEHGQAAVYHDLCLVHPIATKAIIVDDLSLPGIKDAADQFLAEHPEWEAQIHKDHQTHYVMWR